MKSFNLVFLFLLLSFYSLSAQDLQRLNPQVTVNGKVLKLPWAGGLKSPQFSEVDLNNDGILDLFIFDKAGDVLLTFINHGTANTVDYTYAPFYAKTFPVLKSWALLRDFNHDGAMDIFAQYPSSAVSGVVVYKGRFENNRLTFDRFNFPQLSQNIIPIPTGGGLFTQLYISQEDVPAVDDINGDGDLDILTFSDAGGVVYLFENQSVEKGYGTDSLIYIRADACWGDFFESGITACLDLSNDTNECSSGLSGGSAPRHPGSTLLTFDSDNDGDKELVLGDISSDLLLFAYNNGNTTNAWIDSQDCYFPSYDVTLEIPSFPASFFLDVDNDGKKDFIAAVNSAILGINQKSIWFYKNTTSNELPQFNLEQRSFLIDEMIEAGRGASPAFVDYNGDGLLDIVVGNQTWDNSTQSSLLLYENIGTATQPAFQLINDNYLNFRNLFAGSTTHFNFAPAFGDLDGDGDADLLVGDNSGEMLYLENTAGPGQILAFGPITEKYMGIDVGQMSTPQIIDMNRDGLPDLVIGERTINVSATEPDKIGNLNYVQNIGTATAPMFDPDLEAGNNTAFFGLVNTIKPSVTFTGESAPAIFDFDTSFVLFSGSADGGIKVYDQIEGQLDGVFREVSSDYGNLKIGIESRLAVADINSDGFLDLLVGNRRGGLSLFSSWYKTDGTVGVNATPLNDLGWEVELFPNPATSSIRLLWENAANESVLLTVYDVMGNPVFTQSQRGTEAEIAVKDFPAGMYFAQVRSGKKVVVKRFLVHQE